MAKRMLVDATHPEETRVAVINGNKLEDLDFEIEGRKQLKGNVYLAKVIRVEPSLQAAFVEYGGNRHGFLAFSEIHPDYYRIPVADREALIAAEKAYAEAAEAMEDEADATGSGDRTASLTIDQPAVSEVVADESIAAAGEALAALEPLTSGELLDTDGETETSAAESDEEVTASAESQDEAPSALEEVARRRPRPYRSYKIQEVIKRGQVLLIQVTKEERGNKGAALTTYLSLPGRYCVLMPNTPRGGGISRKITNAQDRKRLKDMLDSLGLPDGMAVILRTAGMERSQVEIGRDLDYLLRLWETIRTETLKSVAPKLIYEEANLIKRAIRDIYSTDVEMILVEGEKGFNAARDFMRMLMPNHVRKVQQYRNPTIPLFFRYQVENQIDAIHSPVVQLRSGGYIVINQTEALVAIDVNSGRSTKERNIEETALKTNLEAAEEIARQLRLRDMAGLVVIDFIDMEDNRHNAAVERRLKESMKNDRARIQIGRISMFGLLELSRQRLRPSLIETHFEKCPHCAGTGTVHSVESAALYALRALEEEGIRRRSSEVTINVHTRTALYILNQKRTALGEIERRHGMRVLVQADDALNSPDFRVERLRARPAEEAHMPVTAERVLADGEPFEDDIVLEPETGEAPESRTSESSEEERRGRRRRRRRGGRRGDDRPENQALPAEGDEEASSTAEGDEEEAGAEGEFAANGTPETEEERRRRRRGRRGGRRRRERPDQPQQDQSQQDQRMERPERQERPERPEHHRPERRPLFPDHLPTLPSPLTMAPVSLSIDELFEASERILEQTAPVRPSLIPVAQTEAVAAPVETAAEAETKKPRRRPARAKDAEPVVEAVQPAPAPEAEEKPKRAAPRRKKAATEDADQQSAAEGESAQNRKRGWWNKLIGS